jgi:hypothetical protein
MASVQNVSISLKSDFSVACQIVGRVKKKSWLGGTKVIKDYGKCSRLK